MTLLTIKEVAQRLKISLSKAYRLVATGDLPCYEIGASKRVDEEDLWVFLRSNRKQPVKLPPQVKKHF